MTSTYLSYRVYTQNLARTLQRTAAQTQVARDAAYYEANIGKVKTVDEFLKNDRLFSYAMRAHGMTDMIPSKAFMRKVLTSDLSDPKSFARSLIDTRYQTFARAFNFAKDGAVNANVAVAQTDMQEDETTGLYSESRERRGKLAAAEVENYRDRLGIMKSVDDFLRDDRLVAVALTAYGYDPVTKTNAFTYVSTATLRSVLTSDLSDPDSLANKLGSKFQDLAAAFGFGTSGTLPAGTSAQSEDAMNEMFFRYYENTGNGASSAAAALRTEYYGNAIANLTSVDDILNDSKLFTYVITAFGLDPVLEAPATIRLVLTSDLSDPDSFANQLTDTRYHTMAAAFNFDTDGTIKGTEGAQSTAQLEDTIDLYFERYDDKAVNADAIETTYFKNTVVSSVQGQIATLKKVDDILNNERLYAYLLKAYDLDPATESKANIRKVLTSDVTDPKSYANTLRDPRYRALAAAVNFAADGSVTTPLEAQIDGDELATVTLYNRRLGADLTQAQKDAAKAESTYYHEAINKVRSLDEFLADKRLVTYVLKAYGIDNENLSGTTLSSELRLKLRNVLTSDPLDEKSYVSKLGDERYRELAAAFNFTEKGERKRAPLGLAQSRNNMISTADLYLHQTIEVEAGNQNEGVRLALYFRRKAANIGTAFDILADKALFEVARTALSLPDSMAQMDIDAQAKVLEKRLDFADFKNPAKLDKFLAQFGTLYDQKNVNTAFSPASLFMTPDPTAPITPISFSDSLLASFQGLRLGRF